MSNEESLVALHKLTMLEVLVDSGIQESWVQAVSDLEKLEAIFNGPYQSYLNIRALLSEDKWAYYKLAGITGLREQHLLVEARKNLRRAWKDSFSKVATKKSEPGTDQCNQ